MLGAGDGARSCGYGGNAREQWRQSAHRRAGHAGEWIYRVGMPAKSGIGGGIVAALPAQLGLGTFSPRLDEHGNSVRGLKICEALSTRFGLHVLNRSGDVRTSVIADYDIS